MEHQFEFQAKQRDQEIKFRDALIELGLWHERAPRDFPGFETDVQVMVRADQYGVAAWRRFFRSFPHILQVSMAASPLLSEFVVEYPDYFLPLK